MNEATGELNATVIIVVAVAMLAAFFFSVLWPRINEDLQQSARCSDAICDIGINKQGVVDCYSPGAKNNLFTCPYRG